MNMLQQTSIITSDQKADTAYQKCRARFLLWERLYNVRRNVIAYGSSVVFLCLPCGGNAFGNLSREGRIS